MPATNQSAVSTLIREVLADPDLAHDDVFRRLLQAGLQDLVDAEAGHDVRGADPGWECRLPDMATHPLRRLEVRRFGPLSEADLAASMWLWATTTRGNRSC
ncbi:hypothetical protein [Actinomyces dentalis]|uniref:hypothetical protein n=1 Tax=Actinomyces dentalis TaxID=272548 RepID=UPI00040811C0|nr:hypothetical protein [Actinomyces dentalis]